MKKINRVFAFLLLFHFFFITNSSAQSIGVNAYNETVPASQEFAKIIPTSDGGILSMTNGGLPYIGSSISKMDANYNVLWSIGIDTVSIRDIIETNDGNYWALLHIVTGNYFMAPLLVKINSSGTVLMQKIFYYPDAVSNAFQGYGICKAAADDDGLVLYGGNCAAMHYMMKLDAGGNLKWEKQYLGGIGNGTISAVIPDGIDYVGIYSYFNSYLNVGILKTDSLGNLIWAKTMLGSNDVGFHQNSLVKKNNGDYYIMTTSYDVDGMQNYNVTSSGATITCKRQTCVVPGFFYASGVVATQNTNDEILICGKSSSAAKSHYLKLNSTDSLIYALQAPDTNMNINTIISRNDGTYALCGGKLGIGKMIYGIDENGNGTCSTLNYPLTTSNYSFTIDTPSITITPFTVYSTNGSYAITPIPQIKTVLCGNLAVDNQFDDDNDFIFYPNPASDFVTIKNNTDENLNYRVYDIAGNLVLTGFNHKNNNSIHVGHLPNGMYILNITNNSTINKNSKIQIAK